MNSEIIYSKEDLKLIHKGIKKVTDIISVTFGPAGHKMVSKERDGELWITNDAELIIHDLHFQDYYEEVGRKLIVELYDIFCAESGSGGKTAILILETLLYRIIRALDKNIDIQGYFKGLRLASDYVYQSLDKGTLELDIENKLRLIQTVMGREYTIDTNLINVIDKNVPLFMHPILESTSRYEITDGCIIPCGISSKHHYNGTCQQLKDCKVLLFSKPLTDVNWLAKFLLSVGESGNCLVIFAADFSEQVLVIIHSFQRKNLLKCLPIKVSSDNRIYMRLLKDIAILTGTRIFSHVDSNNLASLSINDLGHAAEITASSSQTFLELDNIHIDNQMKEIQSCMKALESSRGGARTALCSRLSWLRAKIGVLYLSESASPPFLNYRRALKKGLNTYLKNGEEGIVAGGGISYLRSLNTLHVLEAELKDISVSYGVRALRFAILQPYKHILRNAGVDYRPQLTQLIQQYSNLGYDANEKRYVDLLENGTVDSKLGVRKAIEHSNAFICKLLTQSDVQ